jgi:hypothetical protein
LDDAQRGRDMPDQVLWPNPDDPDHLFAYVHGKIGQRKGFSDSFVRTEVRALIDEGRWKVDIVLGESPDQLAERFIRKRR